MYGPGRVKVACCKPCCRTKEKKKTIKKAKETKTEKRISQENRSKKINLRPPERRFFSSPAFRSWVFFWPKTIRKNKATKQEMWIMSILYPKRPFGILSSSKVPNSPPTRLLIFRYFVRPPLSYLDPPPLINFSDISEIVKINCSISKTVSILVQF